MVGARAEFLGTGHYLPLANVLVELSKDHAAGARLIMEAGAGTGYYIASVLDVLPKSLGLAIDLSKYAARRAAKHMVGWMRLLPIFGRGCHSKITPSISR